MNPINISLSDAEKELSATALRPKTRTTIQELENLILNYSEEVKARKILYPAFVEPLEQRHKKFEEKASKLLKLTKTVVDNVTKALHSKNKDQNVLNTILQNTSANPVESDSNYLTPSKLTIKSYF